VSGLPQPTPSTSPPSRNPAHGVQRIIKVQKYAQKRVTTQPFLRFSLYWGRSRSVVSGRGSDRWWSLPGVPGTCGGRSRPVAGPARPVFLLVSAYYPRPSAPSTHSPASGGTSQLQDSTTLTGLRSLPTPLPRTYVPGTDLESFRD
jgi:hypothetical protein